MRVVKINLKILKYLQFDTYDDKKISTLRNKNNNVKKCAVMNKNHKKKL